MIVAPGNFVDRESPPASGWRRGWRSAENLLVIVPLALAVVLPVLEIILRGFHSGISGSIILVQNATLIIGMAGAAIAARERKLLTFSSLSGFLKGRAKAAAQIISGGAAAAICGFLCLASVRFVLSEKTAGRAAGLWHPGVDG